MSYGQLGERLRMARETARMTQTEAARALGLTSASLSQYESGKRRVEALTLDRLSRLYGVPLPYFFGEETPLPEWEEALRLRAEQLTPEGKIGIGRLIQKVHALEELYQIAEVPFPGAPHPPFAPLPEASFADNEVAELAERVRRHFGLGLAPLLDLQGFLESHGYRVFAVPLSKSEGVSSLSFVHPNLGPIVAINEDQVCRHRPFTIAHELAHRLYHHDRPLVLSRMNDENPLEAFAEAFADHFLIPREALHERLRDHGVKVVGRPEEVLHLARYFGVSYGAMLRTLRQEHRLGADPRLGTVRPVSLARALGYRALPCELGVRPLPPEDRLPRVFLELALRALSEGRLSLRRVAELLGISDLELEDRLSLDTSEEVDEASA